MADWEREEPLELARRGLMRLALEETEPVPLPGEGAALAPGGLFHVAKLCFPKGGGVEVHYYDRLRALELLAGLPGGRDGAGELLEALGRSAGALGEVEDG